MMKALALSALSVLAVGSIAQAHPDSTKMSCDAAAALVQSEGAVVLVTGPYTYDRYVAHGGYCDYYQTTRPAWVPTEDVAQCFVGYTCEDKDGDGNGGN